MISKFTSHNGALTLLALSICLGVVVAILGAIGSSAVGLVALVGALLLGASWAVRSVLARRTPPG